MRVPARRLPRLLWVVLVAAGVVASADGVGAWGMDVHRWITERAIDGLPKELQPFFSAERAFIAERSVDPDLWRIMDLRGDRGDEPPNHFLDMDFEAGAKPPFLNIPRDYDDYLAKYGRNATTRYGRLPWRATEVYDRLVAAFRDLGKSGGTSAADSAKYLVAVLAHYIEDAHQPFHGALNYDGQLTNQRGIHARFETGLVLRNRNTLVLSPVKVHVITEFREYMFATLVDSQALVGRVLAADLKAARGRRDYDSTYFSGLLDGTKPIVERRLSEAASGVASAVYSAWLEAGQPVLRPRR